MAKKGGLGRGLNSLLGSEVDNGLPQETASPVKRVVVAPDPPKAQKKEETPKKATVIDRTEEKMDSGEELYSSKEDNITIKGVVERAVEKEKKGEDKPQAAKKSVASISQELNQVELRDSDEVPIEMVVPNPNQPRTNFKKEELSELAESIEKNGLLQPILVRKVGDKYEIIAGERRWQACKQIGLKKVPVRLREVDDNETIMLALIENIQRSDLNPIEEAYGYRRMMERGKMSQSQVAQAVSKGRSTIANALRLLELPEEAQQLLFEEKITAGHARAILSVPTNDGRIKLTERLKREQMSVRETEAIARLMAGNVAKKTSDRPKPPKSYKTVARTLAEMLETDVRVKSTKGKNKIEITFKDEADLERLTRIITSE